MITCKQKAGLWLTQRSGLHSCVMYSATALLRGSAGEVEGGPYTPIVAAEALTS